MDCKIVQRPAGSQFRDHCEIGMSLFKPSLGETDISEKELYC